MAANLPTPNLQRLVKKFNINNMHQCCRKSKEQCHIERHNVMLGLTVTKTVNNTDFDIDTAVAFAVSAKKVSKSNR